MRAAQGRDFIQPGEQVLAADEQEEKREQHERRLHDECAGRGERAADRGRRASGLRADVRLDELADVAEGGESFVGEFLERCRQPVDQALEAFAAHRFDDELDAGRHLVDEHRGKRDERADHQHEEREDEERRGKLRPPAQQVREALLQRREHYAEHGGDEERARERPGDRAHEQRAANEQHENEPPRG